MPEYLISYKIKTFCALFAVAAFISNSTYAQGTDILKDIKTYCARAEADSNLRMVELKRLIPDLHYDLKYASSENFTGKKLYRQHKNTYLRLPVARALRMVQKELGQKGYALKIFDAYRPHSITKKMWELIKDERYVANPSKGSNHNRGLAVDLTIIYKNTGKELDMGTGFDNFTDTAHHGFQKLPAIILQNRQLLKQTMEKYGFRAIQTEWWHYNWVNDRNYEVLDIDFRKLKKCAD